MPHEALKRLRAAEAIGKGGLDGLIVYSNGTCDILAPKSLYSFAGFGPLGPHNAALISKSGQTVLLVEPEWDAERAARFSWIDDVRGTAVFTRAIPELMDELKMNGKVGVAGMREMSALVHECPFLPHCTEGL